MRVDVKRMVITVFALGIALFNFGVTLAESEGASAVSLLYAAVAPFAAVYAPAPGQPEVPSTWMTAGLLLSLLVTFGAVFSFLASLSRIGWARATSRRRIGGPVVIGSSEEANSIVRSIHEQHSELPVHILESGNPAAKGTLGLGFKQNLDSDRLVAGAVKHASHVVVAAENDIETARLSSQVLKVRRAECGDDVVIFQLLRSRDLATSARFTHIAQRRPVGAFHPSELTVREVTNQALKLLAKLGATTVEVKQCGPGTEKQQLDAWINSYNRFAEELDVLQLGEPVPGEAADVIILAGNPVSVAAEIPTHKGRRAIVAVTDRTLQSLVWDEGETVRETATLLEIVDPQEVGLSFEAIRGSTFSVWGWAFDIAYQSLYGPPDPNKPPSRDQTLKAQQSSEAAARFMVENLRQHGFELVKDAYGWVTAPADKEIASMAEAEHNDWMLVRTWIDSSGVERRASYDYKTDPPSKRADYLPFEDLSEITQAYNRKIVRDVYPALAGMFGYGISRAS